MLLSHTGGPVHFATRPTFAAVARNRGLAVLTVALVILCTGMGLPWTRSGSRDRNAFEVARTADALGVVGAPWDTFVFITWFSVPLLCAVTLLIAASGRMSSILVGLAAAVLAGGGAMMVLMSPLDPRPGVPVTLAASVGTLVALGRWWRSRWTAEAKQ